MGQCSDLIQFRLSPIQHLIANQIPATDLPLPPHNFTYISSYQSVETGILVSSLNIMDPFQMLRNYNRKGVVVFLQVLYKVILYNWLVLKRRGWQLLNYNDVIPITFCQAASITHKQDTNKWHRLCVGALIAFNQIVTMMVLSLVTVKMIIEQPDRSVTTIPEMVEQNVPIYVEWALKDCAIKNGYFRLNPGQERYTNESLWTQSEQDYKTAHLVDMTLEKYFLASATNIDEKEGDRFYPLEEIFSSAPGVYVLPKNSPFTEILKNVVIRSNEAGLRYFWITKELHERRLNGFRNFPKKIEIGKSEPRKWKFHQLLFALVEWVMGLIGAVLAFIGEQLVFSYQRKVTSRREVKERKETLKRILEKYKDII